MRVVMPAQDRDGEREAARATSDCELPARTLRAFVMQRPPLKLLALLALAPLGLVVLSSAACSKSAPPGPPPAASVVVPPTGGAVTIIADAKGFTPSEVHATRGAPLSLIFKRTSDNTCATEVVFPELKIRRPLPLNEVVAVDMPVMVEHTYKFQCGMAMWEGAVVVK
jgi:hypothetical protein